MALDDWIHSLVDMAAANEARMDGLMGPIEEIINENEVVFCIWQDPAAPGCTGSMVVKGANKLRGIIESRQSENLKVTAIRCDGIEHAIALKHHLGLDQTN